MSKQTGLYFETRNELIKSTASYLRSVGRDSVITLNCVSQLLKLNSITTLEQDMAVLLTAMDKAQNEIYSQTDEETFNIVKPLFNAEVGYNQCGKQTKILCYGMFYEMKRSKELTGNLKSDIQKSIEHAVMTVEHGMNKDFEKY